MRALLVVVLALGLALPGDTIPDPSHVSLPVAVHDERGRPLTDLNPADFRVTDGGVTVPVVTAVWVPASPRRPESVPATLPDTSAPEEAALVTDPTARTIAIFLDEYHVAAEHSAKIRADLAVFVRQHASIRDLVLVVRPLDPVLSLQFQRGHDAALASIASFEGRLGDYTARNAFERDLIAASPIRVDQARARISVAALQAIATRMVRMGPARKALLAVTQGIPPVRPFGRTGERIPTSESIVHAAMRGNVSISTLDPRPQSLVDEPVTFLSEIVRQTDGHRLQAPRADQLLSVGADLGNYYLLTLAGADDGRFHRVEVTVPRRGVRVRSRPGYWAISKDEIDRAAPRPQPARPVPSALRNSRLIVPWLGQERSADGRTRVSFAWEPAPTRAGERRQGLPPSRLTLKAETLDGTPVFEGVVQSAANAIGGGAVASFDTVPGRVRLRMSIEDASARVLDTDIRELVVGPLDGALAFGTPRVFRSRTAREFAAIAADPAAVPAVSRSFSRLERLLMRVPLYASGAPALDEDVTAVLLNRMGHVMRPLEATLSNGSSVWVTDLSLAGLAVGEYSVRWRATRQAVEAFETVPFRVTP